MKRLDKKHLDDLAKSGLTDKDAKARGIHTMSSGDRYAIPFYGLDGKATGFTRWRDFAPLRPEQKYGQAKRSGANPYFDPTINWRKVSKNPNRRIVFTEGEKKAMAMCKAGIACIAITGKDCWHEKGGKELHPALREIQWKGRVIEIVSDSDREFKPHISRSFLSAGDAFEDIGATVRYRMLPTLSGHTKTGLDDFLVARGKAAYDDEVPVHDSDSGYVEQWRKSVAMAGTLPAMDFAPISADWLSEKPEPLRFLVDVLLPAGVVGLIVGPGGVGKTYLTLWLAMSVACGARFLGLKTAQGRVVYLAAEDPNEVLRTRIHWLSKRYSDTLDHKSLLANFAIQSIAGQQLHILARSGSGVVSQSSQLDALIEMLKAESPTLVVLDPMARLHGLDENDNIVGTSLINAAERVAREVGCTVVLSHHTGKQNASSKNDGQYAPRGASGISDAARVILNLYSHGEEPSPVLKLTHAKNNYGPKYREVFLKRGEHGVLEHYVADPFGATDKALMEKFRSWVKARNGEPFSCRDVQKATKALGGSKRSRLKFLRTVIASGDAVEAAEARNGRPVYLLANTKGSKE